MEKYAKQILIMVVVFSAFLAGDGVFNCYDFFLPHHAEEVTAAAAASAAARKQE